MFIIIVIIINIIEIPNIESKKRRFFLRRFAFFNKKKKKMTQNGEDRLALRVLNKGRASGFPPYGGKPFRLYRLSFNFRY